MDSMTGKGWHMIAAETEGLTFGYLPISYLCLLEEQIHVQNSF